LKYFNNNCPRGVTGCGKQREASGRAFLNRFCYAEKMRSFIFY